MPRGVIRRRQSEVEVVVEAAIRNSRLRRSQALPAAIVSGPNDSLFQLQFQVSPLPQLPSIMSGTLFECD